MTVSVTREEQLEAALRRLLFVTTYLADEAGWEPAECKMVVSAHSASGDKPVATVTLAECLTEAERLVGPVLWTLNT